MHEVPTDVVLLVQVVIDLDQVFLLIRRSCVEVGECSARSSKECGGKSASRRCCRSCKRGGNSGGRGYGSRSDSCLPHALEVLCEEEKESIAIFIKVTGNENRTADGI